MPNLYCVRHGSEREADLARRQEQYREAGEVVLVVHGKLSTGPWLCERCNATLKRRDEAWLTSAFPRHVQDALCDYDFAYERQYFAMTKSDRAAAYGAVWPDDSIRNRRKRRRTGFPTG